MAVGTFGRMDITRMDAVGMDAAGMALPGSPWHGWLLLVHRGGCGDGRPEKSRAPPGTPGRISGRSADAALPSPLFALLCLSWCVNKGGFVIKQLWLCQPGAWRAFPRPCQDRWGRVCAVGELSALLLGRKWVSSLTLHLPEATRSKTCVPAWIHSLFEWTIQALLRTCLLIKSKPAFLCVGRVFWMFLFNGSFCRDYCQTLYRGFDNLFLFWGLVAPGGTSVRKAGAPSCIQTFRLLSVAPDPSRLQERSVRLQPSLELGQEVNT